jgi:hypothetical protein
MPTLRSTSYTYTYTYTYTFDLTFDLCPLTFDLRFELPLGALADPIAEIGRHARILR